MKSVLSSFLKQMDPLNLLGEGQGGKSSPSHDLQHPMKSDRESLDDFEHVASQDSNLQFINFEKGQTEIAEKVKEADKPSPAALSGKSSPEQIGSGPVGQEIGGDLSDTKHELEEDPLGSSKNFMQYDQSGDVGPKKNDLEEMKRTPEPAELMEDSDQSQAEDDDSIVTPASTKEAEVKAATPEPAKPDTPEPVKKTPEEPKAPTPEPQREPSPAPKVPEHQADDADEGAPPPAPVPRDYPEIGVLEPKDILTACGLCEYLLHYLYSNCVVQFSRLSNLFDLPL